MIAYFDCFSGVSGDMVLGALIDLGVPAGWLQSELQRMPLTGFQLRTEPLTRSGLRSVNCHVDIDDHHTHRHYADIRALIDQSPFSERARNQGQAIFYAIARAEAYIHGCPLDKVHLHEVGAIDALVDILGSVLCLEWLGIDQIICSPLPLGSGTVTCEHGILPIPAPATLEILKGVPVSGGHTAMELVTPTGAAIMASLAERFDILPPMQVETVGYGAGKRETPGIPNLLRVILGESGQVDRSIKGCQSDRVVQIDTNLDDMNPEWFGFLMETLFDEGALDVFWSSVQMKKNRPGTMVSVLCREDCKDRIIRQLMDQTTTIGVRISSIERCLLKRELLEVDTPLGRMDVKKIWNPDGTTRLVPEFEACRTVAMERKLPLPRVFEQVQRYLQGLS